MPAYSFPNKSADPVWSNPSANAANYTFPSQSLVGVTAIYGQFLYGETTYGGSASTPTYSYPNQS